MSVFFAYNKNDMRVKRYFAPHLIHELLRCYATPAILHTFGIRWFSKENHRVINQRLVTVLMCVRVNKSELLSCKQERVLTFWPLYHNIIFDQANTFNRFLLSVSSVVPYFSIRTDYFRIFSFSPVHFTSSGRTIFVFSLFRPYTSLTCTDYFYIFPFSPVYQAYLYSYFSYFPVSVRTST